MKRSVLLIGSMVVLAAAVVWLLAENRRLHAQLAQRSPTGKVIPSVANAEPASQPDRPGATQISQPSVTLLSSSQPPTTATRWADPQWRAAQYNQAYLQAEARYARFFSATEGLVA